MKTTIKKTIVNWHLQDIARASVNQLASVTSLCFSLLGMLGIESLTETAEMAEENEGTILGIIVWVIVSTVWVCNAHRAE